MPLEPFFFDLCDSVVVVEEPEVDVYFEPPPIESEADRRNDVRSVWRKLDERLYFVFKARAEAKTFMFPQRITGADETMRGVTKRNRSDHISSPFSHLHLHNTSHLTPTLNETMLLSVL